MIRPITCITFLLACGSGLYLYQTKHKVHVLDARIDQIVHQTQQVREQMRVLHAEWTLLDQPDRLQQLAGQFLTLQPTKPSQFVAETDLDSRLPAPLPPPTETPSPLPEPETPALVASTAPTNPPAPSAITPPAPAQPVRVAEHQVARPAEHATEPVRPMVAVVRTPPTRLASAVPPRPEPMYRQPVYRPAYQPAFSRPPTAVPVAAGTAAYGGSMLGMARNAAPPPPTPAPATAWVNWNR